MSRPADLSGPAVPFAPDVPFRSAGTGGSTALGLPSRSGGPIPFQTNSSTSGGTDLWIMDADGTDPRPFLQSPANESDGAVSPSGKWIAYVSDETGADEVWVQPFPKGGARFRLSESGGDYPVWVSDSRLAFMSRDVVVLADLDVTPTRVRATAYRTVVDLVSTDWNLRPLDVRADGKAIMVVGVSGTARLLVETNRVQAIGDEKGGG